MRMKIAATGIVIVLALGPITQGVAATLPSATKASLVFMVEEEKLARDVYTTLYAKNGLRQFASINKAEQTHMDLMRSLLKTYTIVDPTVGMAVGKFKNTALTTLYKKLIADGSISLVKGLDAGIAVEKKDIADIDKILKVTQPADVKLVLDRLIAGSYNHLAAFTR